MCRNRRLASSGVKEPAREYSVSVQYLGRVRMVVKGAFTGNLYGFSPTQSVQKVDHRDAFYLLESGLFGIEL